MERKNSASLFSFPFAGIEAANECERPRGDNTSASPISPPPLLASLADPSRRAEGLFESGGTRTRCPGASVDAHLTGAEQFLQMPEGQRRKMRAEPAVEPHARFVLAYFACFDTHRA
jgi:hypothetical protein